MCRSGCKYIHNTRLSVCGRLSCYIPYPHLTSCMYVFTDAYKYHLFHFFPLTYLLLLPITPTIAWVREGVIIFLYLHNPSWSYIVWVHKLWHTYKTYIYDIFISFIFIYLWLIIYFNTMTLCSVNFHDILHSNVPIYPSIDIYKQHQWFPISKHTASSVRETVVINSFIH